MTQRRLLKIYLTFLIAFAVFMVVNVIAGAGTTAAQTEAPINYCATSFKNKDGKTITPIYNDSSLDTEEVMKLYHKTMNEQFNWYIARMLANETNAAKTGTRDPLGSPPKPVSEDNPQVLQDCPADGSNFSTYCVGQRLLTDETFGYIAYQRALDCRRGLVFETKEDERSYADYLECTISLGTACPEDVQKKFGPVYQSQKALEMSARLDAIAREKTAAKRALDQTLAAYNELRTAWPMHQKYMAIYQSLIKYRDKLVEIRNQVEEFPSKFIDASTTKCT
jgi:hypothetical protein